MMDLTLDVHAAMTTKATTDDGWAEFEGVASSSDEDLVGDILESGCFDPINVDQTAMLWAHNGAEPVGKWLHIGTVAGRLMARGALRTTLAKGREAYDAIKHKIATGLSVGFRCDANGCTFDAKGRRHVKKARLMEISIVTVPALSGARITEVRSFVPVDLAERVNRLDRSWQQSNSELHLRLATLAEKAGEAVAAEVAAGKLSQERGAAILREMITTMRG